MEVVSTSCRAHYRTVVHDDPGFLAFFRLATPVDVIERMQIGSRPLSRPVGAGVDAMRAVPWMFAWSQSRHMLPGWFGAGHGLQVLAEKMGPEIASDMYASWPFFQGLVDDVEMRLARADMGIAEHYEDLAGRDGVPYAALIRKEYNLALEHVLHLKGLRAAARFGTDAATVDLAAQSLRGPDSPDADRTTATVA
jgi:phosphoenolpyruvate carboxylase